MFRFELKEVGSIIGKRGDNIKAIREEVFPSFFFVRDEINRKTFHFIFELKSGARINISDGTTPERIVTMVGTLETLSKAFDMICQKFEDVRSCFASLFDEKISQAFLVRTRWCLGFKTNLYDDSADHIAARCTGESMRFDHRQRRRKNQRNSRSETFFFSGKTEKKLVFHFQTTGASVQVASEMLPSSTERAVTISGKLESIESCFRQICQIMVEVRKEKYFFFLIETFRRRTVFSRRRKVKQFHIDRKLWFHQSTRPSFSPTDKLIKFKDNLRSRCRQTT